MIDIELLKIQLAAGDIDASYLISVLEEQQEATTLRLVDKLITITKSYYKILENEPADMQQAAITGLMSAVAAHALEIATKANLVSLRLDDIPMVNEDTK